MFNLEQSIAEWREQMLAAGIKFPQPLEELENHLREDIERQMKSGLSGQQVFASAVQKVGPANALKTEFKRAGHSIPMRLVQLTGIACAAIAGVFFLWILANLLVIREAGLAERILGLIAVAFVVSSWSHGHKFLPVIRDLHARASIGFACCLASIGEMVVFIKFVLPSFLDVPARSDLPVGRLLLAFLAACGVMAILAGLVHGLEKAARQSNQQYV